MVVPLLEEIAPIDSEFTAELTDAYGITYQDCVERFEKPIGDGGHRLNSTNLLLSKPKKLRHSKYRLFWFLLEKAWRGLRP